MLTPILTSFMPKSSKTLLTLVKVLVSAGLVYWILRNSNLAEIWNSIRNANISLLIFAFCMFYAGYFITALRWKTLLHAQGVDAPLFYLVKSFMVAVFFNNFLPSTIGGDLMRMYDSYRMGGSKTGAVSVIFIDRLFGVTALLSYALIAILLSSAVRAQIPLLWFWVALAIGGAMVFAYVVFGSPAWLFDRVFALKEDRFGMPVRLLKKFYDFVSGIQRAQGCVGQGVRSVIPVATQCHFSLHRSYLGAAYRHPAIGHVYHYSHCRNPDDGANIH